LIAEIVVLERVKRPVAPSLNHGFANYIDAIMYLIRYKDFSICILPFSVMFVSLW
jgi:hypothetical protein